MQPFISYSISVFPVWQEEEISTYGVQHHSTLKILVQQSSILGRPCQPHLALTIYQYPLTHVKISFFFISVNISKTRVKNSRKANRRGTLKEETYIFCVLGSPCSHKTRILIVQRLSSLMESEASFSPCLCCMRFEYSSVSGINSNEIFCFLPAICCLLAVLKGTAWLKWLQMEILLYDTNSRSHIKHLRWVCKTSKNSYLLWTHRYHHMHLLSL